MNESFFLKAPDGYLVKVSFESVKGGNRLIVHFCLTFPSSTYCSRYSTYVCINYYTALPDNLALYHMSFGSILIKISFLDDDKNTLGTYVERIHMCNRLPCAI